MPRRLARASALLLLGACASEDAPLLVTSPVTADAEMAAPRMFGSNPSPRQGVVTGGDIDDTLNTSAFFEYADRAITETNLPQFAFGKPLKLRLLGADGAPAPGMRVSLRHPGQPKPFYSGYAGVDGLVTVFPALHGAQESRPIELRAFAEGQDLPFAKVLKVTDNRHEVTLPFASTWAPDFLDLVLVLDTTGSMADELKWLTTELRTIVRKARQVAPDTQIRFGLVVYRDTADAYVVRNYGFAENQAQMRRWLRAQEADGGGDYPEAAAAAMGVAADLPWRRGRGERLIFHVADAPPHSAEIADYIQAVRKAGSKDVQIFSLGASGVAAESEYLMRQASVVTGGRYLFLTDDSGIGDSHAEPTIPCYRVTLLNDLVTRVLQSELSGVRVEADADAIVREVGTYRRGVCVE
ncbi:MAG: vWA domain-containing protein [Pseudomonadota bacterium]